MDAPAPRTRPRNRRALTLDAATSLFYRRGYSAVSMADIAEATNVGPSAIYRHFSSKSDLLVAAIEAGIALYTQALTLSADGSPEGGGLADALDRLAVSALDHRELGVLWQRDARNLDDATRKHIRDELRVATGLLAGFVSEARPELDSTQADVLAWCIFGVMVSIGFHSLTLPRREFLALLTQMMSTVAAVPMPKPSSSSLPAERLIDQGASRREQLITAATELFAEHGFSSVGVDDIAGAAGIAGPSVYAHFDGKADILVAAVDRGAALLQSDTERVLASAASAPVKLAALVESFTTIAVHDRFVLRTMLSEMDRLPPRDREAARKVQRDYIDTWVDLLCQFTDESPVSARIRVQAVLIVLNDAVQTPHLRALPAFQSTLVGIAGALLGV